MESIGEKLRVEREGKGFTVEQIARDTNIAKRYLIALEAEDFGVFPGDPYLIGFLRNYSDYLGIDPDEMVALYKNFTIQSQPVPMDELLERKPPVRVGLIAAIIAIVAALAVGGYLLYPVIFSGGDGDATQSETTDIEPSVYELTERFLERRLYERDQLVIAVGEERSELVVSSIRDTVTVDVPGGTNVLRIGDERAIDLNGDATMDIRIALTDIDSESDRPSAFVRVERFYRDPTGQVLADGDSAPQGSENSNATGGLAGDVDGTPSTVGAPTLSSRLVQPVEIIRSETAEPFRVTVTFRGYCLFRFAIDDEQREERYFQKDETIELDVSRELRLWISNAGNTIARIRGNEIDFGRPGEVTTRMITWTADPQSAGQILQMVAMY